MRKTHDLDIATYETSAVGHEDRPIAKRHWRLLAAAFAVILCLGSFSEPRAQSSYPESLTEWQLDWTVLTMSPDGSWGVATDMGVLEAITSAMYNCRAMSKSELGCGAHFITIRAGWSLGLRCGDKNIIVAELDLERAEFSAGWREHELRSLYYPDLPPCVRVVTVDPKGEVSASSMRRTQPAFRFQ
jgi:hypothetical protein